MKNVVYVQEYSIEVEYNFTNTTFAFNFSKGEKLMQVDNSNMNRYITYTFVYNENDQIIEEGEMCGSLLDYLYRVFFYSVNVL